MAEALRDGRRAGVILFRRNIASVEETHSLCSSIVTAADAHSPFISVDQEGGRVRRLHAPFIELPPMRILGEIDDAGLAERAGAIVASELRAVGFNLNFAPVLDLDSNPQNPVIGDRSFGADPDRVVRIGGAFTKGLQSSGVLACGKHFPGHGDTDLDSHFDLPIVRAPRHLLETREIAPFRVLSPSLTTIMSAHVVYDALDPGVPATLSRRIATDLLRGELGFEGVLFSDDVEMRALADRYTVEDACVEAVRAGCDALLVCHSFDRQERALAALVREAEREASFRYRCAEAATRTKTARDRFRPSPVASLDELRRALGGAEANALAEKIRARTLKR